MNVYRTHDIDYFSNIDSNIYKYNLLIKIINIYELEKKIEEIENHAIIHGLSKESRSIYKDLKRKLESEKEGVEYKKVTLAELKKEAKEIRYSKEELDLMKNFF